MGTKVIKLSKHRLDEYKEQKCTWFVFTDGHTEFWNDARTQLEVQHMPFNLVKSQSELWCIEYLKLKEKIRKIERLIFNTENREIEMVDTLNKIRDVLNTQNQNKTDKQ